MQNQPIIGITIVTSQNFEYSNQSSFIYHDYANSLLTYKNGALNNIIEACNTEES